MPIYAYRCSTCGHAQDVLQKMSDPLLTVCPSCSASTYEKQVTAAGFQLKGSGWYVTDFRDGKSGAKPAAEGAEKPVGESKPDAGATAPSAAAPATAPAAGAPAASPAPAPAAAPSVKPAAKASPAAGGGKAA
jgi:putative FmdB family regulatory protein